MIRAVGARRAVEMVILPLVLAACADSPAQVGSCLLVTLDTTRADVLAPYGAPAELTPTLELLAAQGITFERAYTVAPITLPAHASILTGLYPPRHGVRENGVFRLPQEASTLAELASGSGRSTAAFVSAAVLDRAFGLAQGFDVYDAPARPMDQRGLAYAERPGHETVRRALRWVAELPADRDFFLWVHLFDPHAPYAPPPPFRGARTAYLGEVAAADDALGRLLGGLEEGGRLDETFVAVVADHGEGMGDHGEMTHALLPYESTLHAPLVLRWPDRRDAGERRKEVVSVADLFPTIAEVLGLLPGPSSHPSMEELDGRSLLRPQPPERGVYFESYVGWLSFGYSPLAGWIDREGKYVHTSRPAFFDPLDDPEESRDRIAERTDIERYRRSIAEVCERPALGRDAAPIEEELRKSIAALGYAAGSGAGEALPHPLEAGGRPSPLDRIDEQNRIVLAQRHLNAGRLDEAERTLREVLAENPHNRYAVDRIGVTLLRAGRYGEAVVLLERLISEGPVSSDVFAYLGGAYLGLEDYRKAVQAFEAGLAVDPEHAPCLGGLSHALEQLGRPEEAAPFKARLDSVQRR